MSTAFILEPKDLDRIIAELKETVREEIAKLKEERRDKRLNMKEAAKFMNMSQSTLAKKLKSGDFPLKLRHVVGSSKYFLESELRTYLKQ